MTVAQAVRHLLLTYPATRQTLNCLVMAYWVKIDGFPETQRRFAETTPVESIVREARTVFSRQPELSPEAWKAERPATADLFTELTTLFPEAVRVG